MDTTPLWSLISSLNPPSQFPLCHLCRSKCRYCQRWCNSSVTSPRSPQSLWSVHLGVLWTFGLVSALSHSLSCWNCCCCYAVRTRLTQKQVNVCVYTKMRKCVGMYTVAAIQQVYHLHEYNINFMPNRDWGRDNTVLHSPFWNALFGMKTTTFWFKFHLNLFSGVQPAITRDWCG